MIHHQPDFHGNVRLTRIKFISACISRRETSAGVLAHNARADMTWVCFTSNRHRQKSKCHAISTTYNSRARVKFSGRDRLLLCRPNYWSSHDRMARASHRNPSFCLIPIGFYTEIPVQSQLNSFYATRIYMGSCASSTSGQHLWPMLFTYDKSVLNWNA